MSRQKLIRQLKLRYQKLNQRELEEVVDIFSRSIEHALKKGQNIELRGFGTLPKDNDGTETTIMDCIDNCIEQVESLTRG